MDLGPFSSGHVVGGEGQHTLTPLPPKHHHPGAQEAASPPWEVGLSHPLPGTLGHPGSEGDGSSLCCPKSLLFLSPGTFWPEAQAVLIEN